MSVWDRMDGRDRMERMELEGGEVEEEGGKSSKKKK
jgi:hypothetical protein